MENQIYLTNIFKNIFNSYEDFSSWYVNLPLSDGQLENGVIDCPSRKTFALISYKYNGCHLAFDDDTFKNQFAVDLYSYYKEFEATTKSIDKLMNLTDEEVSFAGFDITNFAEIPETENSTNAEEVNYISSQTKNISKKGALQVAREQLSNKRAYTVKTFLKRFQHLFIKVLTPAYVPMVEDNY